MIKEEAGSRAWSAGHEAEVGIPADKNSPECGVHLGSCSFLHARRMRAVDQEKQYFFRNEDYF